MVGVHNIVRCISYRDIIGNALHSSEQSTTKVRFPTMNYDNKQQSVRKTYSIAQLLGPSCKSTESRIQFKVCFRNLSEDDASIYWIDFEGKPVSYGFIRKGRSNSTGLDIDTFVSHPWIAVSRRRKKLLAINFERVFRPMTPRAFLKESIKIDRLRVCFMVIHLVSVCIRLFGNFCRHAVPTTEHGIFDEILYAL